MDVASSRPLPTVADHRIYLVPQYALLMSPSANRVYARDAPRLVEAELAVFGDLLLDAEVTDIRTETLGDVPYVLFAADELTTRDRRCLGNLSSLYAMFELDGGRLAPMPVERLDRYDDDLLTIPRYRGKTNEHFTKLLLNVTAAALGSADRVLGGRLRVLDPMCGRGTTLSQALTYGYDAHGVEIDRKDVDAYRSFFERWLKDKRIKHQVDKGRLKVRGEVVGQRFSVELAASKEAYKAGETQTLNVLRADTLQARQLLPHRHFDLLVADAPYGIQHGAEHGGGRGNASRNPTELLRAALPVWSELVRDGGAVGISWNTHVTDRTDLQTLLTDGGFEVLEGRAWAGFRHQVDRSIDRDLIVARKPKPA